MDGNALLEMLFALKTLITESQGNVLEKQKKKIEDLEEEEEHENIQYINVQKYPLASLISSDGEEITSIKTYLCSNLQKINEILKTMYPPVIFFYDEKEADSLPPDYLKVYNIDGKETDLGFETESIFIHPEGEEVDRIYYKEIHEIAFIPIEGYNDHFAIFAFESDFGFRALLFIQRVFKPIITNIINIGKK